MPTLEFLNQAGYDLSVGPVSAQDSGCRFAHFNGLPVVIVPPFTNMNQEHRGKHLQLMRDAEVIVVPPIPFGEGNLPLFKEVEQVLEEGKSLYLIDFAEVSKRDYSGGKALELLSGMIEKGAIPLKRIEDLPDLIGKKEEIVDD